MGRSSGFLNFSISCKRRAGRSDLVARGFPSSSKSIRSYNCKASKTSFNSLTGVSENILRILLNVLAQLKNSDVSIPNDWHICLTAVWSFSSLLSSFLNTSSLRSLKQSLWSSPDKRWIQHTKNSKQKVGGSHYYYHHDHFYFFIEDSTVQSYAKSNIAKSN